MKWIIPLIICALVAFISEPVEAQSTKYQIEGGIYPSGTGDAYGTGKAYVKHPLNPQISVTTLGELSHKGTQHSTTYAVLTGISARPSKWIGVEFQGGAERNTYRNSWRARGSLFLGSVSQDGYVYTKTILILTSVEKGGLTPWWVESRVLVPTFDWLALGANYETNVGAGPRMEVKFLNEPFKIYLHAVVAADGLGVDKRLSRQDLNGNAGIRVSF